jgi:flagellar hook-associated protein 2
MGTTVGPSSGLSPQYQQLIRRTLQIENQPKIDLENRRQQEKDRKSIISDLDSKLSSLQSQLSTLTSTTASPFEGRSASAEEGTEAFSVSADKTASTGNYSLTVNQLASADGRASYEYSTGGSKLENDINSKQTFDLEVATPSDSSNDRKAVRVELSSSDFSGTNEEVLNNVRSAIDSAFQNAVDNGNIASDERPSVSVVNPTSDTARLSIRSAQTGYDGRLKFSNTGTNDGLLSNLQVQRSDGAVGENADGKDGGYITKVGGSESTSELTSEFTLNGLTLTRNSNEVTDAVDGVTINLDEATGTESSFEVAADVEGAKSAVKEFINRFNEVNTFLQDKTELDPENDKRGALANDATFRRLQSQLRSDATRPVGGQPDSLSTLEDIGVEASRDGTLKLEDEDALASAIREDQGAVKELFAGPDGVATRLENRIQRFADTGGILDNREDSIDNTIDRLDGRIEQLNERLDRREQQLRERYAQVQSTIRSLARQQQALSARSSGSSIV